MASNDKDRLYSLPCTSFAPTPKDAFVRLRQWVEKGKPDGVYLSEYLVFARNREWGNGIVCITQRGLKKGHVVLKMPKTQCLTIRTLSSPELRRLLRHPDFDPVTRLTLSYIYECLLGEKSQWWGYLSCISLPDVPRLWRDVERGWLNGTDVEDFTFDFDVSFPISSS